MTGSGTLCPGQCACAILVGDCPRKTDQSAVPTCDWRWVCSAEIPRPGTPSPPAVPSRGLIPLRTQITHLFLFGCLREHGLRAETASTAHSLTHQTLTESGRWEIKQGMLGVPGLHPGLLILLAPWPWPNPEHPHTLMFHLYNGMSHGFPHRGINVMRTNGEH